jgi:Zn-dependent protease with chaperone function
VSRIVLTLVLWIGFWTLGLLVAGALAWVPFAEAAYEGGLDFSGILAALGALSVLWALRPRGWFAKREERDRPTLTRENFPLLNAFVDEVARRAGFPKVSRVVIANRITAHASGRRPFLWMREGEEVGLGLPLFAVLSRDELATVIAHELGHHLGGDLLLGPWVHRTRYSLAAAVDALDDSAFLLDLPFRAYGRLFLRVSAQVSREQERAADRLAALSCGAAATAEALRKVDALSPLWDVYFDQDVVPLINQGAQLPLLEGFRLFLNEPHRRVEVSRRIEEIARQPPSPWDSHPSTAERLDALGSSKTPAFAPAAASLEGCLDLLGGAAAAEDAWYALVTNGKLARVSWDEAYAKIVLPRMAERIAKTGLDKLPLDALPSLLADADALWERIREQGISLLSREGKRQRLRFVLAEWLSVSLSKRGFAVQARPGGPLTLRRGEEAVEPASLIERLASGALTAAAYADLCATLS